MRCADCICDGVIYCLQREREQLWLKVNPIHKVQLMLWAKAIKANDMKTDFKFMDWGKKTGNDVFDMPDRIWEKA
jgi:hypothetical protein